MVLSGVPRKKSPVTPPGIDPGNVRLVAQCLNHYATPGSYYRVRYCPPPVILDKINEFKALQSYPLKFILILWFHLLLVLPRSL